MTCKLADLCVIAAVVARRQIDRKNKPQRQPNRFIRVAVDALERKNAHQVDFCLFSLGLSCVDCRVWLRRWFTLFCSTRIKRKNGGTVHKGFLPGGPYLSSKRWVDMIKFIYHDFYDFDGEKGNQFFFAAKHRILEECLQSGVSWIWDATEIPTA